MLAVSIDLQNSYCYIVIFIIQFKLCLNIFEQHYKVLFFLENITIKGR